MVITVFYDGICGLCSKEIRHYQKIAPDGAFNWQDITQSSDDLAREGVSLAEGLKLLHAKDSEGRMHIGVDAFILIWRQLKRWRVLAAFVSLPIIRPLADRCYRAFAQWRFKRLSHCRIAAEGETATS